MNCDNYVGDGVLCFDRVIAAGDTLAVEMTVPFCFDGIWVPRNFQPWPLGAAAAPGPGPCVLQSVLIDGRPQLPAPWPVEVLRPGWRGFPMPVDWEPIDSRRGIQLIVRPTVRAVRFCAELQCQLYSRKQDAP